MDHSTRKLENLRNWRSHSERDLSINKELVDMQRILKKVNKQLVQISEIWEQQVPHYILENSCPISLKQGTLEVSASSSATSYHIQRLIREGLLQKLQMNCTSPLKKIKITLVNES